jgi:transcriptional regulator with XRE-family HTH domain
MTEKQLIKAIEGKRLLYGMTKKELCQKVGVSTQYYDNLLKEKQSPTLRNYLAFCKVLEIKITIF